MASYEAFMDSVRNKRALMDHNHPYEPTGLLNLHRMVARSTLFPLALAAADHAAMGLRVRDIAREADRRQLSLDVVEHQLEVAVTRNLAQHQDFWPSLAALFNDLSRGRHIIPPRDSDSSDNPGRAERIAGALPAVLLTLTPTILTSISERGFHLPLYWDPSGSELLNLMINYVMNPLVIAAHPLLANLGRNINQLRQPVKPEPYFFRSAITIAGLRGDHELANLSDTLNRWILNHQNAGSHILQNDDELQPGGKILNLERGAVMAEFARNPLLPIYMLAAYLYRDPQARNALAQVRESYPEMSLLLDKIQEEFQTRQFEPRLTANSGHHKIIEELLEMEIPRMVALMTDPGMVDIRPYIAGYGVNTYIDLRRRAINMLNGKPNHSFLEAVLTVDDCVNNLLREANSQPISLEYPIPDDIRVLVDQVIAAMFDENQGLDEWAGGLPDGFDINGIAIAKRGDKAVRDAVSQQYGNSLAKAAKTAVYALYDQGILANAEPEVREAVFRRLEKAYWKRHEGKQAMPLSPSLAKLLQKFTDSSEAAARLLYDHYANVVDRILGVQVEPDITTEDIIERTAQIMVSLSKRETMQEIDQPGVSARLRARCAKPLSLTESNGLKSLANQIKKSWDSLKDTSAFSLESKFTVGAGAVLATITKGNPEGITLDKLAQLNPVFAQVLGLEHLALFLSQHFGKELEEANAPLCSVLTEIRVTMETIGPAYQTLLSNMAQQLFTTP